MMTTPREEEAVKYLEEHKIGEMMNNLMSMLFFYRPERPREFLIAQLEQLNASKLSAADSPCLFDDSNLDAVFGILDPANQGYISYVQYKEALKTLGIENFNEHPEDLGNNRISNETFKREAPSAVLCHFDKLLSIVHNLNCIHCTVVEIVMKEGLLRCAATFQM